jgi:hypothetical protein
MDFWEFYWFACDITGKTMSTTYGSETEFRVAISRLYYAAFHQCVKYGESAQIRGFKRQRTGADHTAIRQWLDINGKRAVSRRLEELRRLRNTCDYDETSTIGLNDFNLARLNTEFIEGNL